LASKKSGTEDNNIRDLIKKAAGGAFFFFTKISTPFSKKEYKEALGDALIAHWVK